ncbi:MAG TPA: ATP-grasp domain-containing protein [Gemmataceae bacterium]|jgi:D-alanine-D-alanine ligase
MLAETPAADRLSPCRVLILHNQPILPDDHPDADSEHEVLFTTEFVRRTLTAAGCEVGTLGVGRDPAVLIDGLREFRPDVVFNLFEGLADVGDTEAQAAGILEWMEIPYTGCPHQTLCLARGKHLTKHLLAGAGMPTAKFIVVEETPVECRLGWPVIVKPAKQDASVGVDQGSVVTNQQRLNERIALLLDNYGPPVLVEEFIDGREFSVGVVEAPDLRVLPVSEILFTDKGADFWPIVTYDAKWKPGSRDYEATPPKYPARGVSPRLRGKLETLARQTFRLLGCRDYARVDFRVRGGKPYILEVNPNPDFSPEAGLAGGLQSAGISHTRFTVNLVQCALARGGKVLPALRCDT